MKVEPLPIFNLGSVPDSLRQLANRIESGEFSAIRCVVVLETEGNMVDYKAFGEDFPRAYAAGLLMAAVKEVLP